MKLNKETTKSILTSMGFNVDITKRVLGRLDGEFNLLDLEVALESPRAKQWIKGVQDELDKLPKKEEEAIDNEYYNKYFGN